MCVCVICTCVHVYVCDMHVCVYVYVCDMHMCLCACVCVGEHVSQTRRREGGKTVYSFTPTALWTPFHQGTGHLLSQKVCCHPHLPFESGLGAQMFMEMRKREGILSMRMSRLPAPLLFGINLVAKCLYWSGIQSQRWLVLEVESSLTDVWASSQGLGP